MKTLEEVNKLIEEKKKEIVAFNQTFNEKATKLNVEMNKLIGQKELLTEDVKN